MVTNSTDTKQKITDKTSKLDQFKLFFEYAESGQDILTSNEKTRTVRRQTR